VYISAGTGIGQTRLITAYTTGRVATVSPAWDTAPDSTTVYKILPIGRSIVDSMSTAALESMRSDPDFDKIPPERTFKLVQVPGVGLVGEDKRTWKVGHR